MDTCRTCGESVEGAWDFCGSCGSPLARADAARPSMVTPVGRVATDELSTDPARPVDPLGVENGPRRIASSPEGSKPPGRKFSRRAALITVASVLVAGLVAAATVLHLDVRGELVDTRADLASTRKTLASTEADLEARTSDLESTRDSLETAEENLRSTDRQLRKAQRQLRGIRGTLASAEEQLGLQSHQIEVLKTCLNGVNNALVELAYNNFDGALAALNSVQIPCDEAFALF